MFWTTEKHHVSVKNLPALSLHIPSPLSSSAVWNTPPCARGKDAGHQSLSSHGERSLLLVTGSINKNVILSTERRHKSNTTIRGVYMSSRLCVRVFSTCHAMRSLRRSSLSLSSVCCWMYSSVKNAWYKEIIKILLRNHRYTFHLFMQFVNWLFLPQHKHTDLILYYNTEWCLRVNTNNILGYEYTRLQ